MMTSPAVPSLRALLPPEVYVEMQGELLVKRAQASRATSPALSMPRTDEELKGYLRDVFGFVLPDRAVCTGHVSPFRAFADAFFARVGVSVWVASRGFGGKSYLLGMLGLAEGLLWHADVVTLGGSMRQSANVQRYQSQFMKALGAKHEALDGEPGIHQIKFTWGNSSIAIPASQTSARGPHPQRLRLDEVDEMDYGIFNAAMGQPMSKGGIPKQTVISSTHQNAHGTMSKVLERAREHGWRTYRWCHRETMRTADNPEGWLEPSEVESKRGEVSGRMWQIEYDLAEPRAEGLVFPEFSDANLWEGVVEPGERIELAVDDGYVDPRVILFLIRREDNIIVFDELYHVRHLGEVCINEALDRVGAIVGRDAETGELLHYPEIAVGPSEAKDIQLRFRRNNVAYRPATHKVVEGIKRLRRLLQDAKGKRRLLVHRRCENLLRELRRDYVYPEGASRDNDNPVDANNHAVDALRYWVWLRAKD